MAKELPKPGYYRSGVNDVIVLDPATFGDGELVTKDGDDARWQPAVAFRPAFGNGPTRVLSAAVFDHRFKPTTREEALQRVQAAEMLRDKQAGDAERAESEGGSNAEAVAEGPTSETRSPE